MSKTLSEQTGESNGAVELTESARHRLLAARQRRVVLELLADRTTAVGLEELAASVAERETPGQTATSTETQRVMTGLHHVHLPMLDDVGVVDYDPAANRVEAWRFPDQLL